MSRSNWKRLADRLAGSLLTPAPDPRRTVPQPDQFASTLERLEAALSICQASRDLLIRRKQEGEERLAMFDDERQRHGELASGGDALLSLTDERCGQTARKQQFLLDSLGEIETEYQRLQVLRDRLHMQVETFALRREIAAARRSAAEARYDAGESMLGLTDTSADDATMLDTVEQQAIVAAARADAVEQMLADWTRLDDW